MWQTAYVSAYWRNGPVLNGALCGLDEALWDISGEAGQCASYDLLGGKSRFDPHVLLPAPTVRPVAEETSNNVSKFAGSGLEARAYSASGLASFVSGEDTLILEADAGFGLPADEYQENQPS